MTLGKRCQNVLHGGCAEAGKKDNAEENCVEVVAAESIFAGRGVVVGKGVELGGVDASLGHAGVNEE